MPEKSFGAALRSFFSKPKEEQDDASSPENFVSESCEIDDKITPEQSSVMTKNLGVSLAHGNHGEILWPGYDGFSSLQERIKDSFANETAEQRKKRIEEAKLKSIQDAMQKIDDFSGRIDSMGKEEIHTCSSLVSGFSEKLKNREQGTTMEMAKKVFSFCQDIMSKRSTDLTDEDRKNFSNGISNSLSSIQFYESKMEAIGGVSTQGPI